MHRIRTVLVSLVAIGAIGLVAAAPVGAADTAQVRVLHASPDAPAVDVYLDGAKVDALTNVPFGTLSSYLTVPAGAHQVTVYATGTTTGAVIDAKLTFDAGQKYTVAATNALAKIEAQVLKDSPTPSAGNAQIRVVHFSADAPAVDVAPDGVAPDKAIVKNLAYPNATGYLDLPGGTYDLEVRLAGTTTVALQLDPITVKDGTSYTVFAIGSAANPPAGKPLQVVAGVDATSAVPATTMPPTDTLAAGSGSGSSGVGIAAASLLLIAAGTVGLLGGLRLATRRISDD